LKEVLNTQREEFSNGTILHIALYWHYGYKAIELFEILVQHGAEYKRNKYDEFPWEQQGKKLFVPITKKFAGKRYKNKVEYEKSVETCNLIQHTYGLYF